MIEIKLIDKEHRADINIKNQPFSLFGLMLPSYVGGKWDYTILKFPKENIKEMCFPDENYDFEEMSKDSVFIGAYDGDKCVGLSILRDDPFKYMYLYDLKVNAEYRGHGIGKMLIEYSRKYATKHGYIGLYAICQDNNIGACMFYLKNGFEIGGVNTMVYHGTVQEGKSDIYFYLK